MIEEKLQKCRVELQNKKLKKSGENKFAKFKYFELADFIPTVNKMFSDYKMFSNFSIEGEIAKLVIIDCEDKTSQTFTSNIASADVKGCTAIQSLGAVHTYLKRYLYLNALEIVENDSLDASVGSKDFQVETKKITDMEHFENVSNLQTVKELNSYWTKHKDEIEDLEQFKAVCAGRKSYLLSEVN